MKLIIIRCGICLDWHRAGAHCSNCGAYHVRIGHKTIHMNKDGIEMVRGIPMPLHNTIARHCEAKD